MSLFNAAFLKIQIVAPDNSDFDKELRGKLKLLFRNAAADLAHYAIEGYPEIKLPDWAENVPEILKDGAPITVRRIAADAGAKMVQKVDLVPTTAKHHIVQSRRASLAIQLRDMFRPEHGIDIHYKSGTLHIDAPDTREVVFDKLMQKFPSALTPRM